MVIEGVIEKIEQSSGGPPEKPWHKYSIKLKGNPRYIGIFDPTVGKTLETGNAYSFEVVEKGKYLNLAEGTKPEPIAFPLTEASGAPASNGGYSEEAVNRRAALRDAVELTGYNIQHTSRKYAGASAVLSIADQLFAWLNGGPAPTFDRAQAEKDIDELFDRPGAPPPAPGSQPEKASPPESQHSKPGDNPEGDTPGEKQMREAIQGKILGKVWKEATVRDWCNLWGADSVDTIPAGALEEALAWFQGK